MPWSPLPPHWWVTATSQQVLRMAQRERQGGFAFGKWRSEAFHSMQASRSLLGEAWALKSDLIRVEFGPFALGGSPSRSWCCLQSSIFLSQG